MGYMESIETKILTAAEMKAENDALEIELARSQKIKADLLLSSSAGLRPEIKSAPEPTSKDKAKEFWAGTQIAKAVDKYG